ncbi:MAG: hypothetical protein FWB88_08595 [Defluviitaleaceae bacterium]|nr:hypothetical protein [Defluviitaleaceae bacterium]MCL2240060.1 hypothetical protein [Defluviitaleaceae bacterium]
MSKPISFYEKSRELEKGEFFGYPLEDGVIHAYGITKEEIAPYMTPDYHNVHWKTIFHKIMSDRKQKQNTSSTA